MAFDLSHIRTLLRGVPSCFCVTFAIFKGVADDPLHALAGVDVFLHGDLVRRALLEDAAGIDVDALGIFADHDEIDVLGLDAFQRTERRIQQSHRAHVGVQVHLEAHAQQNFFGVNIRGHARIAECAQQDGVEIAFQHGEAVRRDGNAVRQVTIGAPVEMGHLDAGARSLDDFHGLGDDFRADAVSGNDGDALLLAHGMEDYQLGRRGAKQETRKWRTGVLARLTANGTETPPSIAALYNQIKRK